MGITQKYINSATFVEVAHCFPSETFPAHHVDTIRRATERLLNELGVEYCISHWEFILTEDGRIALVEAQLRPAGDWIMNLVLNATDRNPYLVLFDALKGASSQAPDFPSKRVACVFFPLPHADARGKLSIICELEARELRGKALFIDDELLASHSWEHQVRWHSRYVAVLTEGLSFDECKSKCDAIVSQLQVLCCDDSGVGYRISMELAI